MSDIINVCKVRQYYELSCRNCEYYGNMCEEYVAKVGHIPYTTRIKKKEIEQMAIRTGKFSMKAMMEGKTKVAKESLVGVHTHVIDIIKGTSTENGDYVYLFFENATYVSVPSSNIEEFIEYAESPSDADAIRQGLYDVVFETATSKKGRQYYTCYLDMHQE